MSLAQHGRSEIKQERAAMDVLPIGPLAIVLISTEPPHESKSMPFSLDKGADVAYNAKE